MEKRLVKFFFIVSLRVRLVGIKWTMGIFQTKVFIVTVSDDTRVITIFSSFLTRSLEGHD